MQAILSFRGSRNLEIVDAPGLHCIPMTFASGGVKVVERLHAPCDFFAVLQFGNFQVVRTLEIHPELRRRAQPPPQSLGSIGGVATATSENLRNTVRQNTQSFPNLIRVHTQLGQYVFGQNLAGMNGPALSKHHV